MKIVHRFSGFGMCRDLNSRLFWSTKNPFEQQHGTLFTHVLLFARAPPGACCVKVPLPQFSVLDLKWNYDGTSLLLKDREAFCCTFVPMFADSDSNGTPEDEASEEWKDSSIIHSGTSCVLKTFEEDWKGKYVWVLFFNLNEDWRLTQILIGGQESL